jgi:hypothetical protein
MTLDVLFRSIGTRIRHPDISTDSSLLPSLQSSDPSEAQILSAHTFLESIYGDPDRGRNSRAQTPMVVGNFSRSQTPMMVGLPDTHRPGSFPKSPPIDNSTQSLYTKVAPVARDSNLSFISDHFQDVTLPREPVSTPTIRLLPTIFETPRDPIVTPSKLPFWNHSQNPRKR